MASRRAGGRHAGRDNLRQAKACGVRDMAFHKKGSLRIEDMIRSCRVYRRLRNFRPGIEADVSCLKHACGPARAPGADSATSERTFGPRWSPTNLALCVRLKPT